MNNNSERDNKLMQVATQLKDTVPHYDWVGFYILNRDEQVLELGPYSGKATEHTRIPIGKGVCGQVAKMGETMIVQDVSKIDNYLSCSIDVQSEIVVPILKNGVFVAELDIDSHSAAPFTEADKQNLEEICKQLASLF